MTFKFSPATRQNVPLLISLAGGTGSGKTKSALELAKGLAGGKRFAVIDTEAGRALHYADDYEFDHGDLRAPFNPSAYLEAIKAADDAGYPVIVVDSASHEHAGEGGLLDMHEVELQRMAGDDWKRRESCAMASWVRPKQEHKRMVNHLLQLRAHLILCFRAEEKVEMVKSDAGKWVVQPKESTTGLNGWIPISEKNLPYEMTCSFLLLADNPGVPLPIKLQERHKQFFPKGKVITQEAGRLLADWAAGGKSASPASDEMNAEVDAQDTGLQTMEWISGMEGCGDIVSLGEMFINAQRALKAAGATAEQLAKLVAKKDAMKAKLSGVR